MIEDDDEKREEEKKGGRGGGGGGGTSYALVFHSSICLSSPTEYSTSLEPKKTPIDVSEEHSILLDELELKSLKF